MRTAVIRIRTSASARSAIIAVLASAPMLVAQGAIVNGAGFHESGFLAVGSIATLFGTGLSPGVEAASGASLPTTLSGVQLLVNGVAAPLWCVSPSQINFQAPFVAPGAARIF